jgi:hypothetical protein
MQKGIDYVIIFTWPESVVRHLIDLARINPTGTSIGGESLRAY